MGDELLVHTERGLYCAAGDFFVDPWSPVPKAVITHAHGDHARRGMGRYVAHRGSVAVMRYRLAPDPVIAGYDYGESVDIGGVRVSFHPAGHIVGAAQVRIEHGGDVWVVSGDYKVGPDPLSVPFEPVPCRVFITECTFGLPVFTWRPEAEVAAEINTWWAENAAAGRPSLLLGYSLGKAQRLLALLDPSVGPVLAHGAVRAINDVLRDDGVPLPDVGHVTASTSKELLSRAVVLAPPSAAGDRWVRKLGDPSVGFASGWMALRGARRRAGYDRGFVLSDHADWGGLNAAVTATGATRVLCTHGYTAAFSRWLAERGLSAAELSTDFGAEDGESDGGNDAT